MSDGAPKGRGRARGRAKPPAAAQASAAPPPQAQGAPRLAVASTSAAPTPGASAVPLGRSRTRQQPSVSDLTRQAQQISISAGDDPSTGGNGDNGNGKPIGRGHVRSGRFIDPMTLFTRPENVAKIKKGSSGQHVKLQSNFFQLINSKQWTIYKHHVDFSPEEDRTRMRHILLKDHSARFGGHVFDGSSLFSVAPVCQENAPLQVISTRRSDDAPIQITIKRAGTLEEGEHQKVQIMNIIMRRCLAALDLEEIRRNYYDPKAKILIPEFNLELWPGLQTSIGQYENDILMQAEINFKVLRTDTAYTLFRDILTKAGPQNVRREFSLAIIGSIVLTSYNNKTYRVDDVDYSVTPEQTFQKKTREGPMNIRYTEYFEKVYGAKIRDLGQPMLVSRSNARAIRSGMPETVYLVPELCVMTGLTDDMRQNFQLMKACANHTAVGPADRARRIVDFGKRLLSEPRAKDTLDSWGMHLAPRLVEVDARVLAPENIKVAQGKMFSAGPKVDWTYSLRENEMLLTASLTKWLIVYPNRNEQEAGMLFNELVKVGRGMRFTFPMPVRVPLNGDRGSDYIQEIDRFINRENPQLVVCITTNNRADRYAAIKKKCILDKPVPSQVVLLKSIKHKTFTSIATKIAIQINCKIGGAPWTVDVPLEGLMVAGFDVCHDPKDKRKSYGALVATTDSTLARYFSVVKQHSAGDELSVNFGLNLELAVKRYRDMNKALPKKIVVYRDGVGDGNLSYVLENEVESSKMALQKLYAGNPYPLALAFVIVTKRINTRFFDGPRNPAPGTVVDDVVTNPFRYDFFLVSQSVRLGTVTPTHYNVIADTCGLKPDHMQKLTYKLTHMYFNWSGTVRVPAPCQYAHKLAFLTSQSVGADHTNLNNLLYFL